MKSQDFNRLAAHHFAPVAAMDGLDTRVVGTTARTAGAHAVGIGYLIMPITMAVYVSGMLVAGVPVHWASCVQKSAPQSWRFTRE